MRRLEVSPPNYVFTSDIDPKVIAMNFQTQIRRGPHDFLTAQFVVEGEEFQNYWNGDRDIEAFAAEKMKWILELNTTPVDSFVLESIQREQDRVGIAVEENKALAIDQATEAAMRIASEKDLEISALQQMIVELTLMLSMIGQPELPTETPEEPPVEDPPSDPAPTEPIPEEPTNEEFNPDIPTENYDPIGGEGGE